MGLFPEESGTFLLYFYKEDLLFQVSVVKVEANYDLPCQTLGLKSIKPTKSLRLSVLTILFTIELSTTTWSLVLCPFLKAIWLGLKSLSLSHVIARIIRLKTFAIAERTIAIFHDSCFAWILDNPFRRNTVHALKSM